MPTGRERAEPLGGDGSIKPETGSYLRWARNMAGMLAVAGAMSGGALGFVGYMNREQPLSVGGPARELPSNDDGVLRVVTWNMARHAAEHLRDIKHIMTKEQTDVLMMQEVTADDNQKIKQALQSRYFVTYQRADGRQTPLEGGLGNMILSTRRQYDRHSVIIPGESSSDTVTKTTAGGIRDVLHYDTAFTDAKKGLLENRVIVSMKARAVGETGIGFMTTHIAAGPPEVHASQLEQVMQHSQKFIRQDEPGVVCGDFNQTPVSAAPNKIVQAFGDIGLMTGDTSAVSTVGSLEHEAKRIDYCFYHSAGRLGDIDTKVLTRYRTDHMPVKVAIPYIATSR